MKELIVKWYEKLDLPSEWFDAVKKAAENFDPSPFENTEDPYLTLNDQDDKMLCLLYALYKCEDFFLTARKRNIPEDILLASLTEVKRYTLEYITMTKGEKIGILAINWIGKILKGNIYRLGRLEFEIRRALRSHTRFGLNEGENVIAVHIPDNGGPFTPEACEEAYVLAEAFFAKYFPEHKYKCYTCSSWLLDKTLKQFLSPESNIVKFMDTFDIADDTKERLDALTFLFGRGTTVEDLANITPKSSLQQKVKDHLLNGGKLYTGFGCRPRL